MPLTQHLKNWPSAGRIEFCNYSLRYREDLPVVLNNISLNIKAGQKVGVVGRTGAGKTSLAAGLLRTVEASKGQILVDDIDIKTLGLHMLREAVVVVPQGN